MSKTRDTGFLGNVIKVDTSGNVSFVSGSTTLATLNTSGQLSGSSPVLSSSYASNAETLDGLDSTVFTLTSSFAAQTASFTAFTASVNSFTASQLVLNGTYATTGSNTFAGIQTVNSNLVVTGSITAQTLVVQTITSSVDFVTGSTRFGSLSSNTHIITGSMYVTGAFYVTTGSVGIGTTSPSALLQIEGNAGGAGYTTYQNFLFLKNTNTAGGAAPGVNLFVAAEGDALGVEFVSNGTVTSNGSAVVKGYASRSSGHFRISNSATSGSDFVFRTAIAGSTTQVNRMYINSSGNTTFTSDNGNIGTFKTNNATDSYNSGVILAGNANSVQASRNAYILLDPNGANGTGTDYAFFTALGSGETQFGTAKSDGFLALYTADTEKMRISSAGIVTAPSQVSFKAYLSNNPELTKGVNNTVPYNAEEYDTQSNFSTSTYRFTAPVAGKYLFTVNLNVYGLEDTARFTIALLINSSSTRNLYNFANLPTGNTGDTNFSGSDILNLAAGNTVEVRVVTDGSGTFYMSQSTTYNSFSGHLLG